MPPGLPLMKNVLTQLAKSVLTQFRLTTAASATDGSIQKKLFGSGTTALIISNEEMKDIIKIIKSLKEFDLLIKGVKEITKNEAKEKRRGFLAASLLGSTLADKGVIRGDDGNIRACKKVIRAGQNF